MMQHTTHYNPNTELAAIRRVLIRNNSGETIPPFAVMQFTGGFDSENVPYVDKPDEDSTTTLLCFNLNSSILDGEYGWGTCETPNWVAYADDGSGSGTGTGDQIPSPREVWGTEANSWYLHSDQTGFVVIGVLSSDAAQANGVNRVFVMLDPLAISDETGSGSLSGSTSECAGGSETTRELTYQYTDCSTGNPCTVTETIRFPMKVHRCRSLPDCGS